MQLSWHWPWAALAGVAVCVAVILIMIVVQDRGAASRDDAPVFGLDDDLSSEHASHLFRVWKNLGRLATVALCAAILLSVALVARPSQVDRADERSSNRDIVLCLDVSGSTLPYDREVIKTYANLISNFQGERIGLSIFNSTSKTVFPLTDDYALVTKQLSHAAAILKGVESQDDIDKMSDRQYQQISDWLDGTQNRTDATSLIGDGVVGCEAMLPGFAYGGRASTSAKRNRAASVVLATDNVLSGTPTYTLAQALDLARSAQIGVDGLYSGPKEDVDADTTTQMKSAIESHGGVFLTQSTGTSIDELVRRIEQRRTREINRTDQAALIDAPGWWVAALGVLVLAWLVLAWRLKR
ncbi:MAG: VWA domain-containing protein [Bifidobacterium sp.]|nr:VWA domain-containing protein [Bifidobacterium sp.]MCI1865472.1 VWA domain-containing protein [Bifidobacterium sp.]